MRKWIIDTDGGGDDAAAILLALADPAVHVLGITTVFGNVPMATLLPQKHGTDGFFICRLRRDA